VFDAEQARALGIVSKFDLQSETLEDQRHYHTYRLTMGWFMVVGFVLAIVGSVALLLVSTVISIVAISGSIGLLLKGTRMIGAGRRGLRTLAANDAKLPRARLLKS
jgi:hypothetical protein